MADTDVDEKQSRVKPTLELKQRAVKYYNENGIPKCLEGILNKMFLDEPSDVYGYMAEYFASHSKEPSISKIKFESAISSRGYNSINGQVFCTINGIEKYVTNMQGFFDDGPKVEIPKVRSKPATGSKAKGDKKLAAAHSAMQMAQNDLLQNKPKPFDFLQTKDDICSMASKLSGKTIKKQLDIDEQIKSMQKEILVEKENAKPKEENEEQVNKESEISSSLCFDCQRKTKINHAELYLSLLSAKVAAELSKIPLYKTIHDSFNEKEIEDFTLPLPLVSVMKCGTDNPGKLNMAKAVYLAPKPGKSYFETFQKLSAVHRELAQSLQQKLGVNAKLTSNDGSYSPSLERPEQIFEFIQHACNLAAVDFEQEIDVVLDIGASHFYDEEKKKYEISTGNHKTADDLIVMYTDFVERYPVIGIIDGISFKDVDACNQLSKALSGNCYCFGDCMFEENIDKVEDKIDEQQCFGAVLRLGSYFNNLTELTQLSSYVRGKRCGIIVSSTTQQGCTSALVPDVAVAIESAFISLGAITQHESIQAFNRLTEIENELQESGKLKWIDSHSFPEYKEAEVPQDDNAVDDNSTEATKS